MDSLEMRVVERAKMMLRVLAHLSSTYPTPQNVDVGIAIEATRQGRPAFAPWDPEWEMARSTCEQLLGMKALDGHGVDFSTFVATLSARTHARLTSPSSSGAGTLLDDVSALLREEEAGHAPSSAAVRKLVVAVGCAPPSLARDEFAAT